MLRRLFSAGSIVTFFESLLALLAVAILLLQVSRRLAIPYPAMLALAGVALALLPGTPQIALDPELALPLFIAPVLVDAAFDFPVTTVRRLWRPLLALAVFAVLLSTAAVATLGVALAGLPPFAALALGAIVAPPDAAAATAVLGNVSMPRRSVTVLKGESLLNDATTLFLFGLATSAQAYDGIDGAFALRLALAAPGGILFGILLGWLFRFVVPFVTGTLGGNLLEFVMALGVWIVAEKLGLSPILCLVAFAMTLARRAALTIHPATRIHSFAVWDTAVFLLNVLAFLLMGFQARNIVLGMSSERLVQAGWFALAVVLCIIVVRMAWVLLYNLLARRFPALRGDIEPASFAESALVGWCGMRGLVTLATAFALPDNFPQRDLIVLTAFAVVLATLVVQGASLVPLVRLLKLDGEDGLSSELDAAHRELADAGLATLRGRSGPAADHWRYSFEVLRAATTPPQDRAPLLEKRAVGLTAKRRQRERLEKLRNEERVGADAFLILQAELDFEEVALSSEDERHIEES